MAILKGFLILAAAVSTHEILLLSDTSAPLAISSVVSVVQDVSPCSSLWREFTITGWFRSPGPLLLLSIHTPISSFHLTQNSDRHIEADLRRIETEVISRITSLETVIGWTYVSLAVSGKRTKAELCVRQWRRPIDCEAVEIETRNLPELDLGNRLAIRYGGENSQDIVTLDVIDVRIVSSALSHSETGEISANYGCLSDCQQPCTSSGQCLSPVTVRQNTLKSVCQESSQIYQGSNVASAYDYRFGFVIFGYQSYTFSPTFFTKKVVIDLHAVIGDPDLEVYLYHQLFSNEFLGKSEQPGDDSMLLDANTPALKDGISWQTKFQVYISGKNWFNWYTLTFTYYFEPLLNSSSGAEQEDVEQRTDTYGYIMWIWMVFIGIGIAGLIIAAKDAKRRFAEKLKK